uniref:Uncharacterized protein n=1 Tax=Plectus sambesii TaxID=2011161 RepID=A0A914WVX5_9BILA
MKDAELVEAVSNSSQRKMAKGTLATSLTFLLLICSMFMFANAQLGNMGWGTNREWGTRGWRHGGLDTNTEWGKDEWKSGGWGENPEFGQEGWRGVFGR